MERELIDRIISELEKRDLIEIIKIRYSDIQDIAKKCGCSELAVMTVLRYKR